MTLFEKKKNFFFAFAWADINLLNFCLPHLSQVSLCVTKDLQKKHSACAYVLSALSERESKSSTNIHSDPTQYRAGIKEKPLAGAAQKKEKRGKEMRKVTSIHETDF